MKIVEVYLKGGGKHTHEVDTGFIGFPIGPYWLITDKDDVQFVYNWEQVEYYTVQGIELEITPGAPLQPRAEEVVIREEEPPVSEAMPPLKGEIPPASDPEVFVPKPPAPKKQSDEADLFA
jgi:hypothetical protein